MPVYYGSGNSRGPIRTEAEFAAMGPRGDAGYYAHQERLRRNPLNVTPIYEYWQQREEANRRRGGRTGYDW